MILITPMSDHHGQHAYLVAEYDETRVRVNVVDPRGRHPLKRIIGAAATLQGARDLADNLGIEPQ